LYLALSKVLNAKKIGLQGLFYLEAVSRAGGVTRIFLSERKCREQGGVTRSFLSERKCRERCKDFFI